MTRHFTLALSTILFAGVSLFVYGKYGRQPHKVEHSKLVWGTDLNAAIRSSSNTGKPVLVEFGAAWCGPCQEYKHETFNTREFEDLATKFELVEVDVDKQKPLAERFGVNAIPDIYFLNSNGQPLLHVVGNDGADLLVDMQQAIDLAKQPAPAKPLMKLSDTHC